MAADDIEIEYARLSSLSFSDFTPSRETRISSNPFLQEHHLAVSPSSESTSPLKLPSPLKYAKLQFSNDSSQHFAADQYMTIKRSHEHTTIPSIDEVLKRPNSDQRYYCNTVSLEEIIRPHSAQGEYTPLLQETNPEESEERYCYIKNSISQEEITSLNSEDYLTIRYTDSNIKQRPSSQVYLASSPQEYFTIRRPSSQQEYYSNTAAANNPTHSEEEHIKLSQIRDIIQPSFRPRLKAFDSSNDIIMHRTSSTNSLLNDRNSVSPPPLPPKPKKLSSPDHGISSDGQPYLNIDSSLFQDQWILTQSPSPLLLSEQLHFFNSQESHPVRLCSIRKHRSESSCLANNPSESKLLNTFVGEKICEFVVSYIGSCDINQYLDCVDECTQKIIDPQSSAKSTDVMMCVCSEVITLTSSKPDAALLKSISVSDIVLVGQCSVNKRLIGIILWKPATVMQCHLVHCSDSQMSNSLLQSIQYSVQSFQEHSIKKNVNRSCVRDSTDHTCSFKAVYIGCKKTNRHQSVNEICHKVLLEQKPSSSKEVQMLLSLTEVKLMHKTICILTHKTSAIQAIGVYQNDMRYIGYVTNDEEFGLTGHVLWCTTVDDVISLITYFRQTCQLSYQKLKNNFEDSESFTQALMSRLRSITVSRSPSPSHKPPPTHKSPPHISPSSSSSHVNNPLPYMDMPSKTKDSIIFNDVSMEEDFNKFFITYTGTANLPSPFTSLSIVQALEAFDKKGESAGMATVAKNSIQMHISSLGIHLIDKKHKMFVSRNYPRNQIVGFSRHPYDPMYLGFATVRPGFHHQLRVHVFHETTHQLVHQVIDSMKFKLQMKPLI